MVIHLKAQRSEEEEKNKENMAELSDICVLGVVDTHMSQSHK